MKIQDLKIPPCSSVDYSDVNFNIVEEKDDEKTQKVDSCMNGRFQMFNHQISHSKYRKIY